MLEPVTVTVYTPALPVHDSVEVPEPVTLVGASEHVNPALGVIVVVRLTTPAKPCREVMLDVEVPAAPEFVVTSVGLARRVKSRTVKVTVVECERGPLVPVRVTE